MGQRFQAYIRIENPLHKAKNSGDIWNDEDKKKAELYFGKKKFSVIPFHHQWLYGLTAAGVLVKIMKEVLRAKGESHPFSPELKNIPYRQDYNKLPGYGLVELIQALFNTSDLDVSEIGGRFGVERTCYIGDEHFDYEKGSVNRKWANQQERCDMGDNNDGIMIIDVATKKHCFMNLFETDRKEGKGSVYSLPQLEPVSVIDYVRAYYPTEKSKLSSYVKKDQCGNDNAKIQEVLDENREIIRQLTEIVKDYQVLSLEEVKAMFPKTYKEVEKRNAEKNAKLQEIEDQLAGSK